MAVPGIDAPAPTNFGEFWPYYVSQHLHPATRRIHAWATLAGALLGAAGLASGTWAALALAPLVGYGGAWYSHFVIERNKPASFGHPLWSLRGDMRLVLRHFNGTLEHDVAAVRADLRMTAQQLTLADMAPGTAPTRRLDTSTAAD